MMKRLILALAMLCMMVLSSCAPAGESAVVQDMTNKDVLYQVALLQSLVQGYYDGIVTVGELKQHGDTGIGTFEGWTASSTRLLRTAVSPFPPMRRLYLSAT